MRLPSAAPNLEKSGGYKVPPSKRRGRKSSARTTDQLAQGMVLKGATKFQRVAKTMGIPRDNH